MKMKRFAKEIGFIAFLAAAIPMMPALVTVGLWWTVDGRIVMTVYLIAVIALFLIGIMASLKDEMEARDGKK